MVTAAGREPEIDTRQDDRPSVLAIIVTHNGRKWLRESLVGLATQTYDLLDVLVVDDATFDARQQPQIKRIAKRHLGKRRRWGYLRTPRALGYGGAINWALSRVKTDADLLLFIHDDAALEPTAIEHMVRRMIEDPKTAIVGPKILAWDDPQRLEEVGMLIDRFGYPYKGLEDGEIDSGQHDTMNEVFYVTSTVMLVRHDVFRQLRGWDARMQAFSEDLDLCWRARLQGYSVRVETKAAARHAIALAKGLRLSPFIPSRYYIRRNRLRTIFKNASSLNVIALVPLYLLLTLAEMVGFVVLRQPREIINLGKAVVWNAGRIPQTLTERRRAQRGRSVSDVKLKQLTVPESKRVRFYVSHQRDRLEVAWGRRAQLLSQRTSRVKVAGSRLKGWMGVALFFVLMAIVLGFRHIWWSPQVAVGEFLPFPDRAGGLWGAFLAPWRGVGLGQAAPNPPALGLLGMFPFLSFGAAGAAQKLMVAVLGVVAFTGAYKLVSDLVDRTGRVAAGAVYMFGSVGYAGIRGGSLGALFFGAAAPFALLAMVRITGWARPPNWVAGRSVARIALAGAVSAAFVPGSLFLYAIAAVLLTAARGVFVRGEKIGRNLLLLIGGLFISWLMLLPWSWHWFSGSGPLGVLRDAESWRIFAASFKGEGALATILGQVPEGPVLFGLALPLLGLVAAVVGEGQRRRLALAFWLVIGSCGTLMALFSAGTIKPFVSSPIEAGVMVQVCFAGLAGLAIGAFRLDLPRRGLGLIHGATLFSVALAAVLVVAGVGPAAFHGRWDPGVVGGRADASVVSQVDSLFAAEAHEIGPFRALWVGKGWTAPVPVASRPVATEFVTSSQGQVLADLFENHSGPAADQLRGVIDSVKAGTTDRGGALLGAYNIHLVVVERSPASAPWLAQKDLALVRSEPGYLVLRNDLPLDRAALYPEVPPIVMALADTDPTQATAPPQASIERLRQPKSWRFVGPEVSTAGTLFVAESSDTGWTATIEDEELARVDGGWGNAFELPAGRTGRLEVKYPRTFWMIAWLIISFLMWVVVVGASFSRRKRTVPAQRGPRRPTRSDRPLVPPAPRGDRS